MISGTVTRLLEATFLLEVRGGGEGLHQVAVIIDTGFSGDLTLPQSIIDSLDLPWLCRQQGMLADGRLHIFDVYTGTVEWGGLVRTIEIEAAEVEPLLGMSLLEGNRLSLEVRSGGTVVIEELA